MHKMTPKITSFPEASMPGWVWLRIFTNWNLLRGVIMQVFNMPISEGIWLY